MNLVSALLLPSLYLHFLIQRIFNLLVHSLFFAIASAITLRARMHIKSRHRACARMRTKRVKLIYLELMCACIEITIDCETVVFSTFWVVSKRALAR